MAVDISISVQAEGFDPGAEYNCLRSENYSDGATAMFVGNVRDFSPEEHGDEHRPVAVLELEHYPGMAEAALTDIARQAAERWPLGRVRLIHRYGPLSAGEEIVFVGATSAHRQASLDACTFMMDFLKSRAPFWKKEFAGKESSGRWVQARDADESALDKW
ncbi:molybdenum cofactor biosynthesis protein MoaE [uncultured Microbulbifer sp.]|uniref:molybdenum cofactor biosynthesis protein MoaE n=1 Tax=uncultured Microbulbifer sp. TaxID=348147 RepID=UPI0026352AEB|nr:molybdenum cofactor biosynthesis protein MoaE [uncultured Microbulbifer sp.]